MATTKPTLMKAKWRITSAAVFARNHSRYLEHALNVVHPRQLVTFRSSKRWSTAAELCNSSRELPIYFAAIDQGSQVRFKASLREVVLDPKRGDSDTERLLSAAPPTTEGEALWEGKVATLYAISGCFRLPKPFPLSHLRKLSDGKPIAETFRYAYAVVHDETGTHDEGHVASDISEPPARIEAKISRVVRDTALVNELKRLYDHRCQRCGFRLELSDGSGYSEGHHLKPLGKPHNGPDTRANVLILCPNCHALLDLGGVKIELGQLTIKARHEVGAEFINYHNAQVDKG